MVPVQPLTGVAGEDHVYFFTFNAFGKPYEAAKYLNDYIQMVKEQTGHEKVNLLPISLGGTVATAYFSAYPETQDINKVVNVVAALDGSSIVSDLLKGSNIITDEYLYTDLFPDLIGEDEPLSYLVNILVRTIPRQVIYDLLDKALSKVLDTLVVIIEVYSTAMHAKSTQLTRPSQPATSRMAPSARNRLITISPQTARSTPPQVFCRSRPGITATRIMRASRATMRR